MAPGKSLAIDQRTSLYRLYDDSDALLYIGIAFNPRTRGYHHAMTKSWWPEVVRKEICWFDNRREAEAAEDAAILAERPRYNIAGVDGPITRTPPKPPRQPADPEMVTALRDAMRKDKRAEAARERRRLELRGLILDAAAKGMRPSEIVVAIEYRYTPDHVSRIIKAGV